MAAFIAGFVLGGLMGFIVCGIMRVSYIEKLHDRRGKIRAATFPVIDRRGVLVIADRRAQSERRLHSIARHA